VVRAWHIQKDRLKAFSVSSNSLMGSREIASFCGLKAESVRLMEVAVERLGFSPRVYHRILKVSRTIADLEGSEQIETAHLAEALQYRVLDRSIRFSMSTQAAARGKARGMKRSWDDRNPGRFFEGS
jgi:magnesium chelatase family protein